MGRGWRGRMGFSIKNITNVDQKLTFDNMLGLCPLCGSCSLDQSMLLLQWSPLPHIMAIVPLKQRHHLVVLLLMSQLP